MIVFEKIVIEIIHSHMLDNLASKPEQKIEYLEKASIDLVER